MSRTSSNTGSKLLGLVQRIESLDAEIRGLNEDKREVYGQAKAIGIEPADVREAVKYRRDPDAYEERNERVEKVLQALKEAAGTGDANARDARAGAGARGGDE